MSAIFTCDGCGKQEPATYSRSGDLLKPANWYSRVDDDGPQHACSRACIGIIAKKSGKTDLVLPI